MKGHIINEAVKDIEGCRDVSQLNKVRKKYLGYSGIITRELLSIPKLSHEVKLARGKTILLMQKSFNAVHDKKKIELVTKK